MHINLAFIALWAYTPLRGYKNKLNALILNISIKYFFLKSSSEYIFILYYITCFIYLGYINKNKLTYPK